MMKRCVFVIIVGFVTHGFAASTVSANFNVTAVNPALCAISGVTNADFGTWSGTGDLTVTSNATINCTNGATYTVSLGNEMGAYSDVSTVRQMGNLAAHDDLIVDSIASTYCAGGAAAPVGSTVATALVTGCSGLGLGTAGNQAFVFSHTVTAARLMAASGGTYTSTIPIIITF